ncbi:26S protease regulatory subunit 10B [Liparis tanakae]|uniref:26S protease regulatory subunit 10B n=1 Tax=Liparis tanakae TaxID=230148 RepID=A0A4Z2ID53_9TELE|nr:26S protease regulatory subunit 10B [Liparis tanakae]
MTKLGPSRAGRREEEKRGRREEGKRGRREEGKRGRGEGFNVSEESRVVPLRSSAQYGHRPVPAAVCRAGGRHARVACIQAEFFRKNGIIWNVAEGFGSLDKSQLKPGTRVALDMTTLTIMRYLPREVDPLVYNMSHEDPGSVSYSEIGGLSEQIRTGKTLLARAVASQLDCNFLKLYRG